MDDNDNETRLWFIVKNQKAGGVAGRYELRGGERFRIGRVLFHVRELVNDKFCYVQKRQDEEIFAEFDDEEERFADLPKIPM